MAAKKPKGWVKEPVRHGLAAKGIKTGRKTGMKLGKFQPTLKQMEDLLVIAAQDAKTDEEYAQLLEAADNIGDLREDRRIMAAKEGERSGPTGSMPIVDMKMIKRLTLKPGMKLNLQKPARFWSENYAIDLKPGDKVKYLGIRTITELGAFSDIAFEVQGISEPMFLSADTKEKIWNHGDLDFHRLFKEGM
jgi:hypothetical protein